MTNSDRILNLPGPILVLGASGFIGSHIFRTIYAARKDVYGVAQRFPAWRLEGINRDNIIVGDLLTRDSAVRVLAQIQPKVVFNCVAYGAYSFETNSDLILKTNFNLTAEILNALCNTKIAAYVHAGSSSEYGDNASAPPEDSLLQPNSDYSVSKIASANLIYFYGKKKGVPCVNLRLYSVFGPMEDSSKLMATLVRVGSRGSFPPFVNRNIGRDFVYVDDVVEAFILAAASMSNRLRGESINIGTGTKTTIGDLAELAKDVFRIDEKPNFATMESRHWDVENWSADPSKAANLLNWHARTSLRDGLVSTLAWYKSLGTAGQEAYENASKKNLVDYKNSVSAVIACYRDGQAIPIMYERLSSVFQKLRVDYEIIFVNDGSPDDSEKIIQDISARDRHVVGICHARNFGSQAAFRSGMALAKKASCVLLDGDLQDPPELIEEFVKYWKEGYQVVYGRRVRRHAPLLMCIAYKLFYRIFHAFSYINIPKDAGDFSLLDREIVDWMLRFPERDMFLRGLRAFVGFKQTGVDYDRPERMFGRTTNSLLRNIGWAKKGFLSFSNVPLNVLTFCGLMMFTLSVLLLVAQIAVKIIAPELTPKGLSTVIVVTVFFGSVNILGLSIIGEYIAKIFEETKRRPHYIRKALIQNGELRINLIDSRERTDVR